jgi:hypothetical protein
MRTKRNVVKKLAMAVAIPGVTLGALAGFAAAPAMAGTAQPNPMAQYESFHGFGNGSLGNVAVLASGAFFDSGFLNVNSGPYTTVHLNRGNLFTYDSHGNTTSSVRRGSCAVTYRTTTVFTVLGGTGRYFGVHVLGAATITETGILPRRMNGRCNTNAAAIPFTVHTTLAANAGLYLPFGFH